MSIYAMLYHRFSPRRPETESMQLAQQKIDAIRAMLPDESTVSRSGISAKTVIVIGAGFAGLSAAVWLKRLGAKKVIVLEARKRVGGRVRSVNGFTPGRVIEAGAELLGLNQPLWLDYARGYGLGLSVFTPEDLFAGAGLEEPIYISGMLLTPEQQRFIFDEMSAVIEQITLEAVPIDALEPWNSPDAQALDNMSLGDRLSAFDISELTRQVFSVMMENDNAAPIDRQSYLGTLAAVKGGGLMDYWTESEVFRCETGNQSLALCMLSELKMHKNSCVMINCPVTDIEIFNRQVNVCAGGKTFTGDYVVLTAPPSMWPEIRITPCFPAGFNPALGSAIKYLSNIKSRFWIREGLAPTGLSDALGMTWEGTDNQMLIPKQGLELTVFAGGSYAVSAMKASDPRPYFTPRIEQLYPGYRDNALTDCLMDWPRIPWTKTGYSCPRPGQVTTLGPVLAHPYHGRLFFAGEYASPDFFGFMEGALQSGLFAVLRILEQEKIRS